MGANWNATKTASLSAVNFSGSNILRFKSGAIVNASLTITMTLTQEQAYMVAAYLGGELMGDNQQTTAGLKAAQELSFAIWEVFDAKDVSTWFKNNGALPAGYDSDVAGFLSGAYTAITTNSLYDNIDDAYYQGVQVFTPNAGYTSQEYLVCQPITTSLTGVPEPATMLFGFALMGVVATARRRTVTA